MLLPVLIVHYGMLTRDVRIRKYNNYLKNDAANAYRYKYFLDEKINTRKLSEIKLLPATAIDTQASYWSLI